MGLTLERLHQLLSYDPATGLFTRLIAGRGPHVAGSIAGSPNQYRHIRITIDGKRYQAHRLAWFYMTCKWPVSDDIDHRNGIRDDNRWENLREADRSLNMQNQRRARVDNKSGLLGVQTNDWATGRNYTARIQHRSKRIYIGSYQTPEAAHAAYLQVKRQLHEGSTL